MSDSVVYHPYLDHQGSQSARRLVRRLAAYLPLTVTRQIMEQSLAAPGAARQITAATLFADMSGFTPMAETLAADGPRGAEALNRTLLITFTALINAIHDAGGAVSHFHGDAMMVYFLDTDGRAAARALACARFMQSLMLTSFTNVSIKRPGNEESTFSLTIRIGVGYGRCVETIVGDLNKSLEFVLAGTAVDEAVAAQQKAESGQVVASQTVLEKALLPTTGPFRVVEEVPPVPSGQPAIYWESVGQSALRELLMLAPKFIPHALFDRLQNPNTQFVAENRSVTSMFVRFEGIDFEKVAAGQQLQLYYQWACDIVARFGGANSRVNRVLTGDKGNQLHIIFGAPVAPDAPIQAMLCALTLQAERPSFITKQQVGVVTGRVFACAVGSQNRREYTIVGSAVNLSSRLTTHCPDGEVYTDAETAVRVQERIALEKLQPVQLKGKPQPVTIYRVLGKKKELSPIKARFTRATRPPFGREAELAQLLNQNDMSFGGQGGVVALYGPFGSGQMPLLAESVHQWLDNGGIVYTGICQLHLAEVPFAPWKTIWRDIFGLTGDMDLQTQIEIVKTRSGPLCDDCDDHVALWSNLLGLSRVGNRTVPLVPLEFRQTELFRLLRRSLMTVAEVRPLLIIIEDIHWADQHSLDLIDDLAKAIVDLPALLLVTFRTVNEFQFRTLNRANCLAIPLEDLPPERARQLITKQLKIDDLPMLVEQRLGLRDRQGRSSPVNPLFLEESLKMMLANGVLRVLPDAEGHHRVRIQEAGLLNMQVPDTIYNVLLARLDQFPAAGRSLLQVASVIGREFELEMLVSLMTGVSRAEALALLNGLLHTGMVQQVAMEPEPRFVFQHALAHDVVYQSLPYARRQALHADIGELIAERHQDNLKLFYPVLAYHFSQTEEHEKGLQFALAAANDAAAMFSNQGAADLYKLAITHIRALDEVAYWKTAVHIYISRARVLRLLGEFTQATLSATEALKLCLLYGEIDQTLPIYNQLAEIKFHQARYRDVQSLTEKVIRNLGDFTPPAELLQAYLLSGMAAAAVFDLKGALNRLDRAEEMAVAINDRARLVTIWGAGAGVYSEQGQSALAVKMADRAVELARRQQLPTQTALALYRQSRILLQAAQPDEALMNIREAMDLVRTTSHNIQAHMLNHRAAIFIYNGRFPQALADLQMAVDLFQKMDDTLGLLQSYLLWGLEYSQGCQDWREGRRRLVQVGQLVASQPEDAGMYVQEAARLWLGLGIVALNTGHLSQAETLFQKALRAVESRKLVWWHPVVLYQLGMVQVARQATVGEIRPFFTKSHHAISNGGCPDELPLILLQLAKLAEDEETHWQLLEASVAAATKRSRYIDKVNCFREAGELLLHAKSLRLRRLGGNCLAWIEA